MRIDRRPLVSDGAVPVIALIALIAAVAAGCSSSSEDPLGDKCKETCSIEKTHPCYEMKQECIDKCRAFVGEIDKNPVFQDGCAECVAAAFEYAVKPATTPPCDTNPSDPSCCYEGTVIVPPNPASPESQCAAICYEPDGGVF